MESNLVIGLLARNHILSIDPPYQEVIMEEWFSSHNKIALDIQQLCFEKPKPAMGY
jgi:hypothetical protein